jgi:hypothetical protein
MKQAIATLDTGWDAFADYQAVVVEKTFGRR